MKFRLSQTAKALAFSLAGCCSVASAQSIDVDESLFSLSLEALLNLNVSSASGTSESYRDAPAAMIVLTAEELRRRGYTGLDEVMLDLPGF